MDDDSTQPATQQVLDPRRLGRNNSGLSDNDVTDVLLVMHPVSPTAINIVERMADTRREHVLFRDSLTSYDSTLTDIEEQETIIIGRNDTDAPRDARLGADLALRLSSIRLMKQKQVGFVFGRNAHIADIVFGQDSGKRISNQHFRIFLTPDGVLMLEDMSTNGTVVDDHVLKSKDPKSPKRRMLNSGSVICIQNNNDAEIIRFVVRIPTRTTHGELFQRNLRDFIAACATEEERPRVLQRLGGKPHSMKWDGGEKYNIIGVIGKGAFATVHQLATKMEGKLLAAKELEKRRFVKNGQLDRKIDNEMTIMEGLKHPNIVQYVEYHDEGEHLYIIMEYVHHGDLQAYLSRQGSMSELSARRMARQVLSALDYLHHSKVTHRDIKPDNILIANLDPLEVKLSDFGLSKAVKGNETFLKTFCGTLLYCAPEVFPDFPATGKRRRGANHNSYSSSVDIWSFGGVLWFALCGEPPFRGVVDTTGEAMYRNIMGSDLDPTPLIKRGISPDCIELLQAMLDTDPSIRLSAAQCLQHRWLNDGTVPVLPDPNLQSIIEEEEPEEGPQDAMAQHQLSQLSIKEAAFDEEVDVLSDDDFEKLVAGRQPKRIRTDPLFPRNQIRDRVEESYVDLSYESEHAMDTGKDNESFKAMPTPRPPRLFGEISQSALGSSGLLNAHANEALSHEAPSEDSLGQHNPTSSHAQSWTRRQTPPVTRNIPQLGGGLSSPSLLGAESMVRELNSSLVASPQSPTSGAHSPSEPETPKTPDVPQHNSLDNAGKHPSQISEATPKAKPPALDRQISLPRTASFYYDPYDPTTHNLEYASKVSGIDFVSAAKPNQTELDDTMRVSAAGTSVSGESESGEPAIAAAVPSPPADPDIKPPPRRLGKLTATQDSFAPNLILNIDQNRTSWGRAPGNTIVYEDPEDIRISKTSFVIFWYCSDEDNAGAVQELSQKGKDWTGLHNLHAGIFTDATSGIYINGKHLKRRDEKGRPLFGHLHTGDIIQVFSTARGTERLKFKCTLYLGSGREPRPAGEEFAIWPRK